MTNMQLIIYGFGIFFILASLVKFLNIDHWTIRAFDFPQFQFLIIGIIVIVAECIWLKLDNLYDIGFLIGVSSMVLYQAWLILPYSPFYKKEAIGSSDAPDISILVANVYQPNKSYEKVLGLINHHQPDLVFLVETNDRWQQHMQSLEQTYPHHLYHPLDNMYGLLFYSKFALSSDTVRFLVKDDIPSVKAVVTLKDGRQLQFYGLHPEPPSPTENYRSTERDAELYLLAKEIEKEVTGPVIVAGDLNDVAWSKSTRIFQQISGLLDPRKGRGAFNTFHAKYPIRWPLDHIFISDHFRVCDIRVLGKTGSDHFPMYIALKLQPTAKNGSAPAADGAAREEAQEKIEKAVEDNP